MLRGIYKGDVAHLKNEWALIQVINNETLSAQFDNMKLLEGYGWREYPARDFTIEIPSW